MIHLLVRSYVQKPDSAFFSDWYLWFVVCSLLISLSYFNETSGQKLVRKPNGSSDELSLCEVEFSFVFVEAPANFSYYSLMAEGCSGEDVLAVKFSQWVS